MLKPPSLQTLKKYGLSMEEWEAIAKRQNYVCYVCEKLTTTGRLCIDHYHAPKWKKMPPEERKKFVRGLLCWFCNHSYLARGITIQKAKRVVSYLEEFSQRHSQP